MAFTFKLEGEDGTPADPPTLKSAVPDWRPGDTIPLGRKTLHVVAVRPAEGLDGDPVLVLEGPGSRAARPDTAFRRLEGGLGSKRVAFDCPGPF